MARPTPWEDKLLENAKKALESATKGLNIDEREEYRIQILETVSSLIGGYDIEKYFEEFSITPLDKISNLQNKSKEIKKELYSTKINPSLALSSLARKEISSHAQRQTGSYYTDFRLAEHLAKQTYKHWDLKRPAVDPACGTGILLTAIAIEAIKDGRLTSEELLSNMIHACDLSESALRGARLALASLTDNLQVVLKMTSHWKCTDSLLFPDWSSDYGMVIANPPWEKLKITRHEFAKELGANRTYGETYENEEFSGFEKKKKTISQYSKSIADKYPLSANGEVDLYIAFLELCLNLSKNSGCIGILVPAGLIRSEGTASLREHLVKFDDVIDITVFDNKQRFFSIDTRFKFISLVAKVSVAKDGGQDFKSKILLHHASADKNRIEINSGAELSSTELKEIRRDLTVPEIKNQKEWSIFKRMCQTGKPWSEFEEELKPAFCREIDMTNGRKLFKEFPSDGAYAVIEGRMIHQHRFGAKKHIFGTGRSAKWQALPVGESTISPQFWLLPNDIPKPSKKCVNVTRAGFCDITGQTNERSMMAAIIPPGVVCGNKVPTVTFHSQLGESAVKFWVGIVNSFAFDWLIRKVITTTINYFLLRSIPLPSISLGSDIGKEVVSITDQLRRLDTMGSSYEAAWRSAELRVKVDILCAINYGLAYADVEAMMIDFPLLDRGQPALKGEKRSTITKDYFLHQLSFYLGCEDYAKKDRFELAKSIGAIPYIPSQST